MNPKYLGIILLLVFLLPGKAPAQYNYSNEPLIRVIDDIQNRTTYRFLYREAMISGIRVTFRADSESLIEELSSSLQFRPVALKVDQERRQVVIYRNSKTAAGKKVTISGQVIDAGTGERLPFATISWNSNGSVEGVTSNAAGTFHFTHTFEEPEITIKTSYVGYTTEELALNLAENSDIADLNFRLEPTFVGGNEVIITGMNYYSSVDTSLQQSVDIGTFSPLGEANSIRALQQLPAVNISTALDNGLNVRGSPADGFRILLDGITIYNQSHLFGLLDSFNADALQTSGLFYDITPAQYQAPPGGTLSFYTKTGSLNEVRGTAGISNTTARLTLEGPISKGNGSWLISGRNSYMNSVDWLNNSSLIEWGLDVDRPREVLSDNLIDIESRLVRPVESDAHFFDLHGKVYFEGETGNRFILSGYFGQDNTEQQSNRVFRSFDSSNGNRIELRAVETDNSWSNAVGSIQYHSPLSSTAYSYSSAGLSIYDTDFGKDDFTYTRFNEVTGSFQLFTFPLEIKSIINEIKAEQRIDFSLWNATWTFGGSYHYYSGEYFEDSFDRPGFFTQTTAHRVDAYAQVDLTKIKWIDLFGGNRTHFYSNGNYLEFSPRFKATFFPDSKISASAGYSKNYQFLNQISLSNIISSDIWILANDLQPPAAVDYYSAGLYFKPFSHTHFQIEAYRKEYKNMRLHEINTFSLNNTFSSSPWFSDNSGEGEGIELYLKNRFRNFALSQSFTISKMELQNPVINNGDPFYVDWDRRYRYNSTLEVYPAANLSVFLSWMYATGTPNKLAVFGPANDQRLEDYMRADLSLEYRKKFKAATLKTTFSVYNLTDRNNPWYRELSLVIDQSSSQNRFLNVPVEVYDLGIQPSFNISVNF
ncbi:MAG TPA: TonB-dependent receptor [Halalkalibaculum sp.]|nr:TonB-dependent receptor [Halalkalibaculum sp.]